MPITATQIESRKKRIGSSDMAAILGLDPYRNAYDVFLEKTDRLDEQKENQAMEAGKMFEDGVLQYAEKEIGKLTRNQFRSAKSLGFPMGANIDAIVVDTGRPVEAKTAGLYGPLSDTWGDPMTDQVPDRVIIQAHVHMTCVGSDLCYVPAFIGGRGFQMFLVPNDIEIVNIITEQGGKFWIDNVLKDTPPTDLLPHPAIIKRVRRTPETVVDLDQLLVDEWQTAKGLEKEAKTRTETAQTAILTALGDAEAGQTPNGLFTYLEQSRAAYTVQASKYRVARFKQQK